MNQKASNYYFNEPIFIHTQEIGLNQSNDSKFFIVTASSKSQIQKQNESNSNNESTDQKKYMNFKKYLIIEHHNNNFLLNSEFDFKKIRESYFLQQELCINCPSILPVYKIFDKENEEIFMIATKFLKKGILSTYLPGFSVYPNQICNFEKLNPTKKTIIAYGIAKSMNFIHSQQIFFHNLTPDNIFLDSNYYPYLSNFYKCVENASEILLHNDIFNYSIIYVGLFGPIEIIQPNSDNNENISSSSTNISEPNSLIHLLSSMKFGTRPRLDNKLDMTEKQKNALMTMWDVKQIHFSFSDIIQLFENGDLVFTGTDMNQFNEYKKLFTEESQNYMHKLNEEAKEFCYLTNIPFENDNE